jgi:hypothetical protein
MKFKSARPIKRQSGNRKKPKFKIYTFCEGKNTEPLFIEGFSKVKGNGLVIVECVGAQGAPKQIVQACSDKMRELKKLAKKSADPLDKSFEIWAVFDRDEHPKVSEALEQAKANDIKIAFSNPCFEIWPLLHFESQTANIHRHTLQKKLKQHIPSYNPKTSKLVCPVELDNTGNYEVAKKRAISLISSHERSDTSKIEMNPSTDIFQLFDKIIMNGRS